MKKGKLHSQVEAFASDDRIRKSLKPSGGRGWPHTYPSGSPVPERIRKKYKDELRRVRKVI